MSQPRTIFELEALRELKSVKVSAIWHDPGSVESFLERYCKHILCLTGSDEHPYSLRGSGTALKINGNHFLYCCDHQISDFEADKIAIRPHTGDKTVITASHMLCPVIEEHNKDSDYIDIRALEYRPEDYSIANLSSEFFDVRDDNILPVNKTDHFLAYGYPSELQDAYADDDSPSINARVVYVNGVYDGASKSPYVHRMKMRRKRTFNADGMSGGPVFYLGRNDKGFFIGIAGVTIRGSTTSEWLHFVEARALLNFAQDQD
jgi:hypothetical protein